MIGYGTSYMLDASAILCADATRDQALRFREDLRRLLRTWEDIHGLPHSFDTKVERGDVAKKTEHHNR